MVAVQSASTSTTHRIDVPPAGSGGSVRKDISDRVFAMVQATALTSQFIRAASIAVGAYE